MTDTVEMTAAEILQDARNWLGEGEHRWMHDPTGKWGSREEGRACMLLAREGVPRPSATDGVEAYDTHEWNKSGHLLNKAALEWLHANNIDTSYYIDVGDFNDDLCPDYPTMLKVYDRAIELAKEAA
jgi:hypothetical protein